MDPQATRAKPRSYTEDYKRQVVDLVVSSGRTSTAVAAEVGLHATLLCRWVRQYGAGTSAAEAVRLATAPSLKRVPVPTADQAAEIARLRCECDRLRMERDILKNSRGPAIRLREEKQVVVGSTWRGAAVGFLVAFYPVKKRGPWAAAHLRVVTPPWRSRLGN
jgi:transposase